MEQQRNAQHNETRLHRIRLLGGSNCKTLDYGCGNGLLVRSAEKAGMHMVGYDPYNKAYSVKPGLRQFHVVSLLEVIEHLSFPFAEIAHVHALLQDGGKVMIESSFSNTMKSPKDDAYVNPDIGHCTIFSHSGLDCMMNDHGFNPGNHINDNVRIYIKR